MIITALSSVNIPIVCNKLRNYKTPLILIIIIFAFFYANIIYIIYIIISLLKMRHIFINIKTAKINPEVASIPVIKLYILVLFWNTKIAENNIPWINAIVNKQIFWIRQGCLNIKIIIKQQRISIDIFKFSIILNAFRLIPNKKKRIVKFRVEYTRFKCFFNLISSISSMFLILFNIHVLFL